MKKTKIVCTMGPSVDNEELLGKLIDNGMNIARFNFSHGSHEEQKERMDRLKWFVMQRKNQLLSF